MVDGRRKFERSPVFLIVNFRNLHSFHGFSFGISGNFSDEGMSFESNKFDHAPGELLAIKLIHPRSDLSVFTLGEVVWKKDGWYKSITGIRLKGLSEETRRKISALISSATEVHEECPVADEGNGTGGRDRQKQVGHGGGVLAREVKGVVPGWDHHVKELKTEESIQTSIRATVPLSKKPPASFPRKIMTEKLVEIKTQKKNWMLSGIMIAIAVAGFVALTAIIEHSGKAENTTERQLAVNRDTAANRNDSLAEISRPDTRAVLISPADTSRPNTPAVPISPAETSRPDTPAVPIYPDILQTDTVVGKRVPAPAVIRGEIFFDLNSAVIDPMQYREIERIKNALLNDPQSNVRIEGHTDNTGDDVFNIDLSMRRTKAVIEILSQSGIDARRIQTSVFGLSHPVASNNTLSGRVRNRRVEMIVTLSAFAGDTAVNRHVPPAETSRPDTPAVPIYPDILQTDTVVGKRVPAPAVIRGEIFFDLNSAVIDPMQYREIERIKNALLNDPQSIVRIEGHTDNTGDDVFNIDLSMRRTKAVIEILSQSGIDARRIQTSVFGLSHPVASNDTLSGRVRNRRVEMVVTLSR